MIITILLLLHFSLSAAPPIQSHRVHLRIIPPHDSPVPQVEDMLRNTYISELELNRVFVIPDNTPAPLQLIISYRTRERTISYDVTLKSNSSGAVLQKHSYEEQITAKLGQNLRTNIAGLVPDIRNALNTLSDIEASGETGDPESSAETDSPVYEAADSESISTEITDHDEQEAIADPETGKLKKEKRSSRSILKKFTAVMGGGLFIPVGDISSYTDFGYNASVYLGYNLPNTAVRISTGLSSGAILLTAHGSANDGYILLFPLGAGLRISSAKDTQFTPAWNLNAGMAVLLLHTDSEPTQTTGIPFISGGFGLRTSSSGRAGLEFRLDFGVYFGSDITILGISPIIALSL